MAGPAKMMQQYEKGALTRQTLLTQLCQAAADQAPEVIAAELPTDVLTELREWSAAPHDSPDRYRVIASVCARTEFDAEAYFREESRRLYNGLWRWHRYFAESEPVAG